MKYETTKEEKEDIKKELRKILKRSGNKVYSVLSRVSSSGMSRVINFYAITPTTLKERKHTGDKIRKYWLSVSVAKLLDYPINDKPEGVRVGGCGMDMGFHVVYNLGRALYPNGDGKTITGRNGDKKPETDGGYLLKHEWF